MTKLNGRECMKDNTINWEGVSDKVKKHLEEYNEYTVQKAEIGYNFTQDKAKIEKLISDIEMMAKRDEREVSDEEKTKIREFKRHIEGLEYRKKEELKEVNKALKGIFEFFGYWMQFNDEKSGDVVTMYDGYKRACEMAQYGMFKNAVLSFFDGVGLVDLENPAVRPGEKEVKKVLEHLMFAMGMNVRKGEKLVKDSTSAFTEAMSKKQFEDKWFAVFRDFMASNIEIGGERVMVRQSQVNADGSLKPWRE